MEVYERIQFPSRIKSKKQKCSVNSNPQPKLKTAKTGAFKKVLISKSNNRTNAKLIYSFYLVISSKT